MRAREGTVVPSRVEPTEDDVHVDYDMNASNVSIEERRRQPIGAVSRNR